MSDHSSKTKATGKSYYSSEAEARVLAMSSPWFRELIKQGIICENIIMKEADRSITRVNFQKALQPGPKSISHPIVKYIFFRLLTMRSQLLKKS